jgi:hypothetical protein
MAIAVVSQQTVRSDDIFFPPMALLILGIVVLGFAQTLLLCRYGACQTAGIIPRSGLSCVNATIPSLVQYSTVGVPRFLQSS